jgi:transposase
MNLIERQVIANRVVQYYRTRGRFKKNFTVKHFEDEGINRRTIYRIINRFESTGSSMFRPITGRKRSVSTPKNIKKVVKLLNFSNKSIREVANKVMIPKSTVQRIKENYGIRTRRCRTVPKYTVDQQNRAKTNCRKIYRKSLNKVLILDDETYVTADPKDMCRSMFYHFDHKCQVPDSVRFKSKTKFPKRYLVWQAMDELGNLSNPYVTTGTLTGQVYKSECLEKRLIPFIRKYHSNTSVLFWPDLAPPHYTTDAQNCLKSNNIEFVSKEENAPNVPQARPIEQFWNLSKDMYSRRQNKPKSINGFKTVWENIAKNVAKMNAKQLWKNVRKTLRLIGDKGVLEPFKRYHINYEFPPICQ